MKEREEYMIIPSSWLKPFSNQWCQLQGEEYIWEGGCHIKGTHDENKVRFTGEIYSLHESMSSHCLLCNVLRPRIAQLTKQHSPTKGRFSPLLYIIVSKKFLCPK